VRPRRETIEIERVVSQSELAFLVGADNAQTWSAAVGESNGKIGFTAVGNRNVVIAFDACLARSFPTRPTLAIGADLGRRRRSVGAFWGSRGGDICIGSSAHGIVTVPPLEKFDPIGIVIWAREFDDGPRRFRGGSGPQAPLSLRINCDLGFSPDLRVGVSFSQSL